MNLIHNPILKGFNPDPSICRVNDDYYIATSTFEWFPGVQIHHSTDLIHWTLIAHPLSRISQLDLNGCGDSCGVWAPNLTHDGEQFHLVYTNVKRQLSPYKDAHNYIVTANSIDGDWSEPTYINSSGFDPSLFHDDDGKKYFLNVLWEHRVESGDPARKRFHSIIIQEVAPLTFEKIGSPISIHHGTEIGLQEAPNLYKRNGYYYLLLAEGGTTYEHAASIARSRDILGPYENAKQAPFITSYLDPTNPLQKAGHGSLCRFDDDLWIFAHLCGRPIASGDSIYGSQRGYCSLGRETAIQRVEWKNDWPHIVAGPSPSHFVVSPYYSESSPRKSVFEAYHFPNDKLDLNYQTPRNPIDERQTYYDEQGLNLIGKESLSSFYNKNLIGRRWQSLFHESITELSFYPDTFQQSAGLVNFYNSDNYVACGITKDDVIGLCLEVFAMDSGQYVGIVKKPLKTSGNIFIKSKVEHDQFSYEVDSGQGYEVLCAGLDCRKLSDDYILKQQDAFFTGTFVAIYCYDLHSQSKKARFKQFSYKETDIV